MTYHYSSSYSRSRVTLQAEDFLFCTLILAPGRFDSTSTYVDTSSGASTAMTKYKGEGGEPFWSL